MTTRAEVTARRRVIVQMLAEGYAIKQIGARVGLSYEGVTRQIRNIKAQHNLRNLADITRYAYSQGIIAVRTTCSHCGDELANVTLKCDRHYLEDILAGRKTFEVRQTQDRSFQAGDRLVLTEFDRATGQLGGSGFVVISIRVVPG